MAGISEHADAVAAARAALAEADGRALRPLPDGFAETRSGLHLIAEYLLKPKRVQETGNEIALRFTPGGFGMDPWAGKAPGQARVEGLEVVLEAGGETARANAGDPEGAASLLGVDAPEESGPLALDQQAAAALASWFAYGSVVLAALLDAFADADPEPIRLWPEHFDVATVLGDESAGSRANYGASPGDEDHPEPYLYVGPWVEQERGETWNATAFAGAELSYEEIAGAEDQVAAGLEFLSSRARALGL